MGLIDRLNVPEDRTSPFARALAMRGDRLDDEAARDAAGNSDAVTTGETASDNPDTVDPGAAVRALLKELHRQYHFGITTPSHLFSMLHRHLQVTSGAILVPEQGVDIFSPMAEVGLDNTTTFRLRLPGDVVRALNRRQGADILRGVDRSILEPYLSHSDYSQCTRIAVLPFSYGRDTLAILLVFDSPLLDLELNVLDVLLAAFAERAGYLLFDGRTKPMTAAARVAALDSTHIPEILKRVTRQSNDSKRDVEILQINLKPVIEAVASAHPHLSRVHLLQDVMETCAILLADNFSVFVYGAQDILIIGLKSRYVDSELLVHVIGTTIQQLFGIGSFVPLPFSALDADSLNRAD